MYFLLDEDEKQCVCGVKIAKFMKADVVGFLIVTNNIIIIIIPAIDRRFIVIVVPTPPANARVRNFLENFGQFAPN